MGEYLVIGSSKAGKTALLSTLYHASVNPCIVGDRRFKVAGSNPAMVSLISTAQQTIRNGRHPADSTNNVKEYEFTLEIKDRKFGLFGTSESSTFRVWDGPGGVLFPLPEEISANFDYAAHTRFREILIEALKRADGFMLCLDTTDQQPALAMFEHLPGIMMETGLANLPCKRVCICLTKSDALFAKYGRDARRQVEAASPRMFANQTLLPIAARGTLRGFCASSTRIGFGWSSVYGFLPSGEPNYDRENDGLRFRDVTRDTVEVVNNWRPFRVLDPFVFLANGDPGTLEVVKADSVV